MHTGTAVAWDNRAKQRLWKSRLKVNKKYGQPVQSTGITASSNNNDNNIIIILLLLLLLLLLQKYCEQCGHVILITQTTTTHTTHSAPAKQTSRSTDNDWQWLTDSRRTPDTGMNDSPSSQQPPTSDDAPAQDTGVSRIHLSSAGLERADTT